MELVTFNNSSEARRAMAVKMFRYQEWCKQMDFDTEDENNWNSFCEGQQGQGQEPRDQGKRRAK